MDGAAEFSWTALLAMVRSDYPELYRSWFDSLQPGRLEAGELRVSVEDAARARYLRESCTQAFINCLMALTGLMIPVRVVGADGDGLGPLAAARAIGLARTPLNADYTFEQFVVGPSNRLAHAACRAVCERPGRLYNPLFIHGPSGLGKSHLLQATCDALRRKSGEMDVVYVSCETFINDFVRAIETGDLQQFRDGARQAHALVIDDVQFIANRESSQEELFHTFNVVYQSQNQIILSADSAPSEIPTLEDRLVSRFNWGLVAQIDPPNRETRQAILQKKARLRGCEVPDEVLDYIAEHVQSNIRLLEGALTRLISETQIGGKPMNLETARELLDSFTEPLGQVVQISDIIDLISRHFGVKTADLVGRKRSKSVSQPRQVGMYLARRLTPLSLEEIGAHFGGRDHSTVLHAERVVERNRKRDRDTAEMLTVLTRRLTSRHQGPPHVARDS